MKYPPAIFMIESGQALALVRHHIAESERVREEGYALARELGVEHIVTSRDNGALLGVTFDGAIHPDFTKPKKGVSYPKPNTEWARRFAAQTGYQNPSDVIATAFAVPLCLSYRKGRDQHGSRRIGVPFSECGFLYLSAEGPYGLWLPDIPAEVADSETDGYRVDEPAKSFRMEFDGCRRIEREEWDILVAQHNLARKRARAAAEAANAGNASQHA